MLSFPVKWMWMSHCWNPSFWQGGKPQSCGEQTGSIWRSENKAGLLLCLQSGHEESWPQGLCWGAPSLFYLQHLLRTIHCHDSVVNNKNVRCGKQHWDSEKLPSTGQRPLLAWEILWLLCSWLWWLKKPQLVVNDKSICKSCYEKWHCKGLSMLYCSRSRRVLGYLYSRSPWFLHGLSVLPLHQRSSWPKFTIIEG